MLMKHDQRHHSTKKKKLLIWYLQDWRLSLFAEYHIFNCKDEKYKIKIRYILARSIGKLLSLTCMHVKV